MSGALNLTRLQAALKEDTRRKPEVLEAFPEETDREIIVEVLVTAVVEDVVVAEVAMDMTQTMLDFGHVQEAVLEAGAAVTEVMMKLVMGLVSEEGTEVIVVVVGVGAGTTTMTTSPEANSSP